jgi:hypothetical protein
VDNTTKPVSSKVETSTKPLTKPRDIVQEMADAGDIVCHQIVAERLRESNRKRTHIGG